MDAGGRIEGRVFGPDGGPAADVPVMLLPGGWAGEVDEDDMAIAERRVTRTDAEGRYAIEDLDNDGAASRLDCDDGNPLRLPGNAEVCDGLDNDCDGVADSGGSGVEVCNSLDDDCDGIADDGLATVTITATRHLVGAGSRPVIQTGANPRPPGERLR